MKHFVPEAQPRNIQISRAGHQIRLIPILGYRSDTETGEVEALAFDGIGNLVTLVSTLANPEYKGTTFMMKLL